MMKNQFVSGHVSFPNNADQALSQRPTTILFMRIAYLECFSGMSGDMFLGALVDAGVPPHLLEQTVTALKLSARLEISRVVRSGISATKIDVWVDGEKDMPREEYWDKENEAQIPSPASGHEHGHHHHHDKHAHAHEHDDHSHAHTDETTRAGAPAPHEHSHAHSHHGRGLIEIRDIIGKSSISDTAKKAATAIFEALGAAEAKIHNMPIERVHFHEVGAVDAMARRPSRACRRTAPTRPER